MRKPTMRYAILNGLLLIFFALAAPLTAAEQALPELGSPAVTDSTDTDNGGGPTEESPAPSELLAVPEPPEIPQAVQSGEPLEPEITIIQRDKETVEEFRINGRLYKVKITPNAGPPYYLFDTDGDGVLETRDNNDITDINIPQWVLFSW
ncbi:MAG: DUF2782 domain-containing protein [Gammaproteobacteria bacterium]